MKKLIRNRIFIVIITIIICVSGTLYATTIYKASDVVYNASDGTSMNVNDALNDLYNKNNNTGYCYSYQDGLAVFYNPVTGLKCNASEAVSTTGTKTGCMKWYIFNYSSESSTVNMILDHNTTASIVWNASNKNVAYEKSNVKTEVDKLVSESKWIDTPRLISTNEISKITGKNEFDNSNDNSWYYFDSNNQTGIAKSRGASKYAWLYDYTYGCADFGCTIGDGSNYGYWTSNTVGTASAGKNVWLVYRDGRFNKTNASTTGYGIRPVITISKSKLS